LIKLHGSVDWTHASARRSDQPDFDFAALREMQNPRHARTIPIEGEDVLRIRAVENMARSWQVHQGADASLGIRPAGVRPFGGAAPETLWLNG
jgi:hypothetical protein